MLGGGEWGGGAEGRGCSQRTMEGVHKCGAGGGEREGRLRQGTVSM